MLLDDLLTSINLTCKKLLNHIRNKFSSIFYVNIAGAVVSQFLTYCHLHWCLTLEMVQLNYWLNIYRTAVCRWLYFTQSFRIKYCSNCFLFFKPRQVTFICMKCKTAFFFFSSNVSEILSVCLYSRNKPVCCHKC